MSVIRGQFAMLAMMLNEPRTPLRKTDLPQPIPGADQVLVKVHACGVCRTDLHVVDGELSDPKLPLIPGHEIVGTVAARGDSVERFTIGDRIGVPWLGSTCGICPYCKAGRENLCDQARFTGYQLNGGYAEFTLAHQDFCFPIPPGYSDARSVGERRLARQRTIWLRPVGELPRLTR